MSTRLGVGVMGHERTRARDQSCVCLDLLGKRLRGPCCARVRPGIDAAIGEMHGHDAWPCISPI